MKKGEESTGLAAGGQSGRRRSLSERRNVSHSLAGGDADEQRRGRSRTSSRLGPDDMHLATDAFSGPEYQTEEYVQRDADEVVHSFMVSSYQLDQRHNVGESEAVEEGSPMQFVDETPHIPELQTFPGNPLSPATQVGRRLAHLGDEFQRRHGDELDMMVSALLPSILSHPSETPLSEAFHAFRNVAIRLFEDGAVTWGRIVSLLAFGYRMALALFRRGVRGFVGAVVGLVVRFMIVERIVRWVADNGGWLGAWFYRLEPEGSLHLVANNFSLVLGVAALAIALFSLIRKPPT